MKRILFVDDQPEVLDGLRRALRSHRDRWQLVFASTGHEALDILRAEPCDVIVSDMRMPVMDGAELLDEVMRRYPNTVRIMLSGQSEDEQILRAIGPVHQYLTKPCLPESLMNSIERACALRGLIRNPNLMSVVSSITALPSLPRIFIELVDLLKSPDVSIKLVGELISHDLAISCRLLQLVNSCYFGWSNRIESLTHAASLVGLDRLRALTLSAGIFSTYEGKLPPEISLDALMERSLVTSLYAQRLMTIERPGESATANDAMMAGTLLDVGHLILLQSRTNNYSNVLELARMEEKLLADMELAAYQVTHAQLGAYLTGLWGLSDSIIEAIAYHHDPLETHPSPTDFTVLSAVHIADALVQESNLFPEWPFGGALCEDYVDQINRTHRTPTWREDFLSFTAKLRCERTATKNIA